MLERDVTAKDGLLAKSLPKDWTWERIPDQPNKRRHGIGFDGYLHHREEAVRVEVKIGWAKLTKTEYIKRWDCLGKLQPYWVLRYFEDFWILEEANTAKKGTLGELLAVR